MQFQLHHVVNTFCSTVLCNARFVWTVICNVFVIIIKRHKGLSLNSTYIIFIDRSNLRGPWKSQLNVKSQAKHYGERKHDIIFRGKSIGKSNKQYRTWVFHNPCTNISFHNLIIGQWSIGMEWTENPMNHTQEFYRQPIFQGCH